jgi:cytochrome c oxidase cbb3-type subunit 4
MEIDTVRSLVTLLSFFAFLGICAWAYSGRRRQAFTQAEQLPFQESEPQHE